MLDDGIGRKMKKKKPTTRVVVLYLRESLTLAAAKTSGLRISGL